MALGLGAALALHFLWDWIALWAAPPGARAWQVAGALALMLTGLLAYAAAVVYASEQSRRRFAPASRARLWGWPFSRPRRDHPSE